MGARRLVKWKAKKDDRPFKKQEKAVLHIRGFKGNRVIYEDVFDAEGEAFDVNEIFSEDESPNESSEPLYSEPTFATITPTSSCRESPQIQMHSPESGYDSANASSSSQGYTSRETSDEEDESHSVENFEANLGRLS